MLKQIKYFQAVVRHKSFTEARLMVVGGKGFLPMEGGEKPFPFASTIHRVSLCRGDKPVKSKYCAFWKADNSGYYVEEFAKLLKGHFKNLF